MMAVELRNITVDYGKYPVITDFSLTVASGEAVLLKGPSGCGKSTLLHVVCGLIPGIIEADVGGEALLFGENVRDLDVAARAKKIGIVFQNPETQLFCDSVEDEIAFGLENLCVPPDEIGHRITEMLDLVGMADFRYASPKELSGGQKQRIVLAAVLALDPQILLLDEALSQMDGESKGVLLNHLCTLRRQGKTMLMVDHDNVLEYIASSIINL
ncbi:MAG: energy-coupling factor ABC transporter ATP-binding protein [Defluviitaleaceae bacterium]|nr:energy-coupling factor ABC transporter ATP-binding protein [Defluviitaleaceae bacterium]